MLRVLINLLTTLAEKNTKQELWTKEGELKKKAEQLNILIKDWPLADRIAFTDLAAFIQQNQLAEGLVCYHGLKSFLVANPKDNPSLLCLYNSLFPPYGRNALRRLMLGFTKKRIKNLKGVVVASHSQKKEAEGIFSKVSVIPSGVDTNEFIPSKDRQNIIGFLGRVRKEKGVELLFSLASYYPSWQFEFAGAILDNYNEKRLPANVKLLGVVPKPSETISRWSIMVLPSFTEAMPLSILEGMSSGLAVVATDTGDIKDLLDDVGVVFPVGDLKRLKEALDRLTQDKSVRDELGYKARKKALQFDWSKVMKMWVDLLCSLEVGP